MPFISMRDGHRIFVRDIGKSSQTDQAPIILLHGFGMQSLHWLPFALPISTKQRFIIPDLRGFGHSHLTPHNQDCIIRNYADDLEDLKAYYGLKKIKLAGISMGAFVALQYQATYGDADIAHYLHIDQSPRSLNNNEWRWGLFGQNQKERLDEARSLISDLSPFIQSETPYSKLPNQLKKRLWENLGEFFASALSKPTHKQIARFFCSKEPLAKVIMPVSNWPTYIHCLRAYLEQDYDMETSIRNLKAPMSLLVGLKSEMYPCGGQLRIADYHKNCEVITFNNSGHTPLIDEPLRFLSELKRFASSPA